MKRIVVAALLALASCAAPARNDISAGLEGSAWTYVDHETPVGAQRPTLRFEAGRASGTTGCNRWSARTDIGANSNLRFYEIQVTEMACAAPAMEVEQRFIRSLRRTQAAAFDVHTSELSLLGEEMDELGRLLPDH